MGKRLKNLLRLSLLALTAITVMVAYQPVSVLASQEFISIALQSGIRNTRRTDSYTGDTDFNIQFERVSETPVSIIFDAVVTTASDRTNQVLKYYVEPLYTETAPIVPKVLAIDEIRRQTTYEDRPIYTPTVVNYTSQYGNYVNDQYPNGTYRPNYFIDYSRNGQNVLKEGNYETWDLPTLAWSWTEQVQTGTEQIPVYTYTTVNYASHLGTENPEYSFSINPNISRGWGNGILHFRVTLDNGLLTNPNGGWGSSGILVIEINGVKYYDTANSSWWDATWLRRKTHTIAHTGDGAQSNYQMKFTVYKGSGSDSAGSVYLGGNCQDDFDDIRFTTNADPAVAIDFWIESYTSGTSAVIWAEIPSIPAHPDDATIYIYYNNPTATAASSGANTFIFFDHFDSDLSKWTGDTSSYAVSSSRVSDSVSHSVWKIIYGSTTFGQASFALRMKGNVVFTAGHSSANGAVNLGETHVSQMYFAPTTNEYLYTANAGTGSGTDVNYTKNAEKTWDLLVLANTSSQLLENDSSLGTKTTNPANSSSMMSKIGSSITGSISLDFFLVRNYTLNEPTHGAWGAEEGAVTTATNPPTANSGAGWTDPANAYDNDADYAYVTSGTPSASNTWGTYGFSLSGATIKRVRVRYDAYSAGYTASPTTVTRQATGDDSDTGTYTPSSGGSDYAVINDSNDATYVTGATNAGGHDTYTYTAFAVPAGATVSKVSIHYRHRSTGAAGYAHGAAIKIGSTYYSMKDTAGWDTGHASGVASGDAIEDHVYDGANNPATGAAWTVSAVNSIAAFGVASTDFNPDANFYQCDISVTYTPATEYDDQIRVDVSWDGGTNWSSTQNTVLTSAETTTWYDVTSATAWTPDKLSNANLKVRALGYTQNNAEVVRLEYLPVEVVYDPADYDISNTPDSKAFGVVATSTSYYAKGSAPSNPVVDGDCTFAVTNNGASAIDLDMKITDFTGGVGWNIGAPGENQARITAYYSGQDPASGLVLANTDAEFYDALAASAHIHWDFKLETPTSHTDGTAKSATLTLTATAED